MNDAKLPFDAATRTELADAIDAWVGTLTPTNGTLDEIVDKIGAILIRRPEQPKERVQLADIVSDCPKGEHCECSFRMDCAQRAYDELDRRKQALHRITNAQAADIASAGYDVLERGDDHASEKWVRALKKAGIEIHG